MGTKPTDTTAMHPLDTAPVNSKLVVVRNEGVLETILAGPNGQTKIPASKLPEGAVILKVGEHRFESRQLSPAIEYPVLKTATAGEAITGFVPHFHRN